MDKILVLLDLIKQAAQAPDKHSFEFITLNKTNTLTPYKQAVFWQKTALGIRLGNVSGNMSLDKNGPYALFLKNFIKTHIKNDKSVALFSHNTINPAAQAEWKEHIGAHAALLLFKTDKDGVMGGLWLEREKSFNAGEEGIFEELAFGYAQSFALLQMRHKSSKFLPWANTRIYQKLLALLLVIICLIPVHLSVTAPAEIIAQNPTAITVPFDGVIDEMMLSPGDPVKAGQTLFKMERTDLEGKINAAAQTLQSAQKNLSLLRRESLSAPEKKAEIARLNSLIAERKIEFEHTQKQLERSDIKAPINGIAIFSDKNDYEGQPVSTGTKIITIADPKQSELLIKIPVDNMLPINKQSPVKFFLNVSPLNGYSANITSMGYQASPDNDGILTYKIRADIQQDQENDPIRIGWKGTAKIKGEKTILAYSILRRPLIALRNIIGL